MTEQSGLVPVKIGSHVMHMTPEKAAAVRKKMNDVAELSDKIGAELRAERMLPGQIKNQFKSWTAPTYSREVPSVQVLRSEPVRVIRRVIPSNLVRVPAGHEIYSRRAVMAM